LSERRSIDGAGHGSARGHRLGPPVILLGLRAPEGRAVPGGRRRSERSWAGIEEVAQL